MQSVEELKPLFTVVDHSHHLAAAKRAACKLPASSTDFLSIGRCVDVSLFGRMECQRKSNLGILHSLVLPSVNTDTMNSPCEFRATYGPCVNRVGGEIKGCHKAGAYLEA